ncbi:MAG: glycosyltransferase family A protein [Candidatus Saganbacteria bacterium]|nr:glycosyltransferase family A protein [Candidatus Saganbacteria bacterium]
MKLELPVKLGPGKVTIERLIPLRLKGLSPSLATLQEELSTRHNQRDLVYGALAFFGHSFQGAELKGNRELICRIGARYLDCISQNPELEKVFVRYLRNYFFSFSYATRLSNAVAIMVNTLLGRPVFDRRVVEGTESLGIFDRYRGYPNVTIRNEALFGNPRVLGFSPHLFPRVSLPQIEDGSTIRVLDIGCAFLGISGSPTARFTRDTLRSLPGNRNAEVTGIDLLAPDQLFPVYDGKTCHPENIYGFGADGLSQKLGDGITYANALTSPAFDISSPDFATPEKPYHFIFCSMLMPSLLSVNFGDGSPFHWTPQQKQSRVGTVNILLDQTATRLRKHLDPSGVLFFGSTTGCIPERDWQIEIYTAADPHPRLRIPFPDDPNFYAGKASELIAAKESIGIKRTPSRKRLTQALLVSGSFVRPEETGWWARTVAAQDASVNTAAALMRTLIGQETEKVEAEQRAVKSFLLSPAAATYYPARATDHVSMGAKVKVAVVIPCFIEEKNITRALEQLTLKQDLSSECYSLFIVIKRAPGDHTEEKVRDFLEAHPHLKPSIEIVYEDEFPGTGCVGHARAVGIARALDRSERRGKLQIHPLYIINADADTLSAPEDYLSSIVQYFEANPTMQALAYSKNLDDALFSECRQSLGLLNGRSSAIRAEAYVQVDGIPAEKTSGEDLALGLRVVARYGEAVGYLPQKVTNPGGRLAHVIIKGIALADSYFTDFHLVASRQAVRTLDDQMAELLGPSKITEQDMKKIMTKGINAVASLIWNLLRTIYDEEASAVLLKDNLVKIAGNVGITIEISNIDDLRLASSQLGEELEVVQIVDIKGFLEQYKILMEK